MAAYGLVNRTTITNLWRAIIVRYSKFRSGAWHVKSVHARMRCTKMMQPISASVKLSLRDA